MAVAVAVPVAVPECKRLEAALRISGRAGAEELLRGRLDFLFRRLALARRERPLVAERIDDDAVARSPEHVRERHLDGRPRGDSAFERGVAPSDQSTDGGIEAARER